MLLRIFQRMASSSNASAKATNRLAKEKSAYLLQHATNPVDWYPWGPEAFEKAKRENKPIFLSVGYSTCHWCHVMEHESFESEEIAKYMNENFVNIKIDREERPDIDKQYMTYVQAMTGSGGWPMSVWLTPDLRAVMAGTYYPPDDNRYIGRPGFKTILQRFTDMWQKNRPKMEEQSKFLAESLGAQSTDVLQGVEMPRGDVPKRLASAFERRYDSRFGGFSKAPKFPQPGNMVFLLRHFLETQLSGSPDYTVAEQTLVSMEKMALGGIWDHVGLGFHRYSVDQAWHVPHFEKMLYDQGQLAECYSEAYMLTKDAKFARTAEGIVEYMLRDLYHPLGGFYSGEDADSYPTPNDKKKTEGAFYVWTYDEVSGALKDSTIDGTEIKVTDVFCKVFDVEKSGNVDPAQDPHDELTNKNVLIMRKSISEFAKQLNIDEDKLREEMKKACKILEDIRNKRPRPHRDEKFVTSWNGMAISGLVSSGLALQRPDLIEAAVKAANFVRTYMFNEENGHLLRTAYAETKEDGSKPIVQIPEPIPGVCADYASMISALIDLYEATLDVKWLEWATQLQETQNNLFWDDTPEKLSYFISDNPLMLFKLKDEQDGAEPGSNSVSCLNLIRLADYLGRSDFREMAEGIFKTYGELISQMPIAVPSMIAAFLRYKADVRQYVVGRDSQNLMNEINSKFDPFMNVYNIQEQFFAKKLAWLDELRETKNDFTGVIVCDSKGKKELQTIEQVNEYMSKFTFLGSK